jgi:hypothetical protein
MKIIHPHLKMLAHLLAKQMWLTNKSTEKWRFSLRTWNSTMFDTVQLHLLYNTRLQRLKYKKHASWVKDALHLSAITRPRTLEPVAPRFRKATLLLFSLIRNDVSLTGMKRFTFDQQRSWVCTSSPNFWYSKLRFLVEVNLTFMKNMHAKQEFALIWLCGYWIDRTSLC